MRLEQASNHVSVLVMMRALWYGCDTCMFLWVRWCKNWSDRAHRGYAVGIICLILVIFITVIFITFVIFITVGQWAIFFRLLSFLSLLVCMIIIIIMPLVWGKTSVNATWVPQAVFSLNSFDADWVYMLLHDMLLTVPRQNSHQNTHSTCIKQGSYPLYPRWCTQRVTGEKIQEAKTSNQRVPACCHCGKTQMRTLRESRLTVPRGLVSPAAVWALEQRRLHQDMVCIYIYIYYVYMYVYMWV